ncbi:hypothetical protein PAMA_001065 [Pampus argenteus]
MASFCSAQHYPGKNPPPSSSSSAASPLGRTSNEPPLLQEEKGLERGSQHLGDSLPPSPPHPSPFPLPVLSQLGSIGLSSSPPVAPLCFRLAGLSMQLDPLKLNSFFDLCISFRAENFWLTNFVDDQTVLLKNKANDFATFHHC